MEYKKYYVVYRYAYLSDDGRNKYIQPLMVIEDENICKDFCKKHGLEYDEEIIENEN